MPFPQFYFNHKGWKGSNFCARSQLLGTVDAHYKSYSTTWYVTPEHENRFGRLTCHMAGHPYPPNKTSWKWNIAPRICMETKGSRKRSVLLNGVYCRFHIICREVPSNIFCMEPHRGIGAALASIFPKGPFGPEVKFHGKLGRSKCSVGPS